MNGNTSTAEKVKKQSQIKDIIRRFFKNKTAVLGFCLLMVFVLVAIFQELIIPYETALEQTRSIREAPSAAHIFGTDTAGRDLFARIIHGTRTSILIGVIGTVIPHVIGLIIGASAGYFGGTYENIIMRLMDVIMSIPNLLLSLAIVSVLGANLQNLIIALCISGIPGSVRNSRALIMGVSDNEYVKAAKSYGASNARIIAKYLLPDILGPLIVHATMGISNTIVNAASLSFLGMGIQPPNPEWGYMLSQAREYMRTSPYLIIIPGFTLLLLSLSFNLVGDGLQDALNPKLKD